MKRKLSDKRSVRSYQEPEDFSDMSDSSEAFESKIVKLKKQLKQLDDKVHPEYVKCKTKMENWLVEQRRRISFLHDYKVNTIKGEFEKELEACERDCELEQKRIQDYLISLCEDLKRRLEHDKKNIELTPSGDILDYKPAVTRKLRRRAGTDFSTNGTAGGFMYWGDMLMCGSGWSLGPNATKLIQTDSNFASMDPLRSPLPMNTNMNNDSSMNNDADAENTEPGKSQCDQTGDPPTAARAPSYLSSSSRQNLFGSLGMNPLDGSLLSCLVASINSGSINGVSNNPYLLNSLSALNGGTSNPSTGGLTPNSFSGVGTSCMGSRTTSNSTNLLGPSVAGLSSLSLPNSNIIAAMGLGIGFPQPQTKKRKQNSTPIAQLNLLLPENDIYADLTIIHRTRAKAVGAGAGSSRKSQHFNSSISPNAAHALGSSVHSANDGSGLLTGSGKVHRDAVSFSPNHVFGPDANMIASPDHIEFGSPGSYFSESLGTPIRAGTGGLCGSNGLASPGLSVWIDDGRLYYGNKCFQYGAAVLLEGRDGSNQRFSGTIVAVGAQDVTIRRSSDHGICRVTVQQLKQGRYALWPNKSN